MLLVLSVMLSLLMSFIWKDQIQVPWWAMVFAFALAWIGTLPIGVIQATTNQQPGYDIIAQFIFGYVYCGKPVANLLFKIYGRISTVHALAFLSDLKLGHYMKIPPRCMYTAQEHWWLGLSSLPLHGDNICDFDAYVISGLIGPEAIWARGVIQELVGAVLPVLVLILHRMFPENKWIPLINIPVISYGFAGMPAATPTNILVTGMIYNFFVFTYRKEWWKYNYVLFAALDDGTAFIGVLIFFALQNENKNLKWWGTEIDHCPLASCPTAPGIVAICPLD